MTPDAAGAKDGISIEFVREAAAAVRRCGIDEQALLERAGIPPALMARHDARVSAERFSSLWLLSATALDDEFFGLDSHRMKVGSFASLTRFCLPAAQLRGALGRACRFVGLLLDDLEVAVEKGPTLSRLVVRPTDDARRRGIDPLPFAYETLLVMLYGLSCWLIGRRIPVMEAQFGYPQPPRWPEYRTMFSQTVFFDQPQTALVFETRMLAAAVTQDERSAHEFLRAAPLNFIVRYGDTNSWSARVRRELRALPPQDWPGFEALAGRLDISPSALRRRLDREEVTFRSIKDTLRRDIAIDHLTHSKMAVPEVAFAAGFSEPSAFHRAFKHWTGVRPAEYRRQLGNRSGDASQSPPAAADCIDPSPLPACGGTR